MACAASPRTARCPGSRQRVRCTAIGLSVDIYTRSSRAGDDSSTHEQQEREARAFAQAHDLIIGRVLRDRTKSSSATLERPVLQEALRRVESKESNGVVVAYLSRATRDTRQGLELLDRITRAGGTVYAPNLPDYTTADGRMLTTIQFAIDAGYRDRKGEELEKRKRESIEAGVPVHTRAAVGLRKRRDKRLEHDPRTGPVVREFFDQRAQGVGPSALGRFLESRGVQTSQGSKTWSKQAVYNLIRNPIYKGVLRYGRDDRYVNADAVVGGPLVDPATWEAAQRPAGRRLAPAKSGESSWLVSGVLRCAACRYSMQGTTTSRGKRIYRCTRTHAGGVCPEPARIDADAIEAAAVAAFWQLTADIEATGVRDATGKLDALERAVELAEQRLAQLSGADAQDALGDQYLSTFRQRREELDAARLTLGEARVAASPDSIPSSHTLRGAWERMSIQQRRELLGVRFHALALSRSRSLVVYPAGSEIELPTRGFKRAPVLAAFPSAPRRARVLTL